MMMKTPLQVTINRCISFNISVRSCSCLSIENISWDAENGESELHGEPLLYQHNVVHVNCCSSLHIIGALL